MLPENWDVSLACMMVLSLVLILLMITTECRDCIHIALLEMNNERNRVEPTLWLSSWHGRGEDVWCGSRVDDDEDQGQFAGKNLSLLECYSYWHCSDLLFYVGPRSFHELFPSALMSWEIDAIMVEGVTISVTQWQRATEALQERRKEQPKKRWM